MKFQILVYPDGHSFVDAIDSKETMDMQNLVRQTVKKWFDHDDFYGLMLEFDTDAGTCIVAEAKR